MIVLLAALLQTTNCTFYFGQMQCVTTQPQVVAPPNPNVMFQQPNAGEAFARGFAQGQQRRSYAQEQHDAYCAALVRGVLSGQITGVSREEMKACEK